MEEAYGQVRKRKADEISEVEAELVPKSEESHVKPGAKDFTKSSAKTIKPPRKKVKTTKRRNHSQY